MPAQEMEKLPKTALILEQIAENGPKTEYDLYTDLPELSHGTVHFCLKKLTGQGILTIVPTRKKDKRPKKLYNLTFLGTVTYLSSLCLQPEDDIPDAEVAEYWKDFDSKIQRGLVEFLEKQGRLLKYVPFQEIKWLVDHFPGIVRGILLVSTFLCRHPPPTYKKPLVYLLFHGLRGTDLEKLEAEQKKNLTNRLEMIFEREFTDLFFQLMFFLRSKGRTNNYRLRQFAEEHLEDRIHETVEIQNAVELFSRRKLTPDKMLKSKRLASSSVQQLTSERQAQS
jgi:DNA-binding PadR family transcriptional regulator